MAERIKRKHADLLAQLNQAIAGVTGEPNWPANAPTKTAPWSDPATRVAPV